MADLELVNSERADSERPDCELSEPITDADEDSPQTEVKLSKKLNDKTNDWITLNRSLSETIRDKYIDLQIRTIQLNNADNDLKETKNKLSALQMRHIKDLKDHQDKMQQLENTLNGKLTSFHKKVSSLVMVLLSPPPHCPEGWYSFPKKCIFFSKNKKTWEKSEEDCTNKNATLASFDLEDPDWMTFLEFIKTEYWIGMWFTRLSVGHWVNRYPRPANLNNMSCGFTSDLDIGVDDCVMSKRWMCEINKDSEDS
ncbi:C-type lectin domain family 12 member A-like isoform 2-T2 [Discoglossus pictus]